MNRRFSLYLHVPFCVTKCAYCDFNSFAGMDDLVTDYVRAVKTEIERSPLHGAHVPTVFFGGGTPTFLEGDQLADILDCIRRHFELEPECEITSEANPGTVDPNKLTVMRKAGFNRLSLGVQSFDDGELQRLDRIHKGADAEAAFAAAREAGFDNVNMDFIFALPEQTREGWARNLNRAIALGTEHLSLYGLIVEPNTPFYRLYKRGKLRLPAEDDEIWMFEHAMQVGAQAGYNRYEVSNYAKPGLECRHNLVYWRNEEYLGFGPGAVSYIDGVRWTNIKHPRRYNQKALAGEELGFDHERLSDEAALGETVMLGLRMTEGLSLSALEGRFGLPARQIYAKTIDAEVQRGRLEYDGDTVKLTPQGLMLASEVSAEFLILPV